ncbi:class C sortase [Christensenellaceae bacterium OttesenSCG-928-L17]|nr:class C sortase [Christensenellaceae bacterium OttesenSCG-928-L17]
MKKHASTIILAAVFVIGLSLLLYPTLSEYWNSSRQSRAIANYAQTVEELGTEELTTMREEAQRYNANLLKKKNRWHYSDAEHAEYMSLLNPSGSGVIGYVLIPKVNVSLPIYHTTEDSVLQKAVGHFEGSSLPVGGEGTHAVLSGHRGLPSAVLFSDLDQMEIGDLFQIKTLDAVLTYEVENVLITDPDDVKSLEIETAEDLCTLVTCTPYGVNTHRLLIRGHRIEMEDEIEFVISGDAIKVDAQLVAPLVAAPILVALLVVLLVRSGRKKKKKE